MPRLPFVLSCFEVSVDDGAATTNGTFARATFLPMTRASPNLATEITLNNGTLSANTWGCW
jgi:hypothetical protein